MTDKKCSVCGGNRCPCPVCHGNPKKYLGGIHAGKSDAETGAVKCNACGKTSDRA